MASQTQVGRPTVINEDTVRKLEAAFRDGFSVATACSLSGISRSTYYEYLDKDEEFSDKMDLAKSWVTERAKKVVVQSIDKGDLASAKWWLERRARAEFGKDSKDEGEQQADSFRDKLEDRMKAFMDSTDDLE